MHAGDGALMFGPDLYKKLAGIHEPSIAPELLQLEIEFGQRFCTDVGSTRLQSVSRSGQLPAIKRKYRVLNTGHGFARGLNEDAHDCFHEIHASARIEITNAL